MIILHYNYYNLLAFFELVIPVKNTHNLYEDFQCVLPPIQSKQDTSTGRACGSRNAVEILLKLVSGNLCGPLEE